MRRAIMRSTSIRNWIQHEANRKANSEQHEQVARGTNLVRRTGKVSISLSLHTYGPIWGFTAKRVGLEGPYMCGFKADFTQAASMGELPRADSHKHNEKTSAGEPCGRNYRSDAHEATLQTDSP
jgi:hypothetical protein